MSESFHQYLDRLLNVPPEWKDVCMAWVFQDNVKHIKRIPGGALKESFKTLGLACTGRLASKTMATTLSKPRIALVDYPLDFTPNGYIDIIKAAEQEAQHVKKLVNDLMQHDANLIVTRRAISRHAIELLESRGVVVALNVREKNIEALKKLSEEKRDGLCVLTCDGFRVETFVDEELSMGRKTILFFDSSKLGTSVVLRGASLTELTRIKAALQFATFCVDNLRKERSLLNDLNVKTPEDRFFVEKGPFSTSPFVQYPSISTTPTFPTNDWIDYHPTIPDLWKVELTHSHVTSTTSNAADESFEVFDEEVQPSTTFVQQISILQTLVSPTLQNCHPPEVILMKYYGAGDVTLGKYLEQHSTSSSELCTCGKPLALHFTTLSHASHQLKISTQSTTIPPNNVWSECKTCQSSVPLALSNSSLNYSMGKFLELAYYHPYLWSCQHDDFEYVFTVKNGIAVKMKRQAIKPFTIISPPLLVQFDVKIFNQQRNQEATALKALVNRFYDSVLERLKVEEASKGSEKVSTERIGLIEAIDNVSGSSWDTFLLTPLAKQLQTQALAWEMDFTETRKKKSKPTLEVEEKTAEPSPQLEVYNSLDRGPPSPKEKDLVTLPIIVESDSEEETPKTLTQSQDKVGLMKTLAGLLTGNTSIAVPLVMPFVTDHLVPKNPVIIREDEPSSLASFVLASPTYRTQIKSLIKVEDVLTQEVMEQVLQKSDGTHLKVALDSMGCGMSCEVLFAEQFEVFRRCCGMHDQMFIQSLSRCVKWESMGGKSGSTFYRTRDKRFILKQLSKQELDGISAFAPAYFRYCSQVLFQDLPTALAKIFGVYRIEFKRKDSKIKLDFVVMENLFYTRKMAKIFDLKGSMRNRLVNSTGKSEEVLMDENLVQFMQQSPLYIQQHAKKLLTSCVWNDTIFLSSINVMDYSLLVGLDKDELVLGIIDFIRAFTWDKKVESWVKDAVSTKEPTIISPKQYKSRFREAMDRYFLVIPEVI